MVNLFMATSNVAFTVHIYYHALFYPMLPLSPFIVMTFSIVLIMIKLISAGKCIMLNATFLEIEIQRNINAAHLFIFTDNFSGAIKQN